MSHGSVPTPLARARGLGSAGSGAGSWWRQRLTAVALAPLTVWLVISLVRLLQADHAAYLDWLSSPVNTVLMTALVVTLFYHMALGLRVIAEDYLHVGYRKISAIVLIDLGCLLLAITGIAAIVRALATS